MKSLGTRFKSATVNDVLPDFWLPATREKQRQPVPW